ncbi:hypothetical protein A2129_02350 [Candidatus Woesebacteria bacterium GWC1_42_13]|uniref:Type IV secretion system protein n=2 Tax=Candidatus Woeseibacteriota TaxID=1752722 RepID=A0A1F7WV34_9BACT|nr:MAG: hypothetical protein UV74_C0008G0003 [Candidatus Woesebacteria bacterium GW2011_GWB1_43_14]OGM06497.1 MAG: hypothetical protein A2129_02350 [Candidatus Woesebacteria bacterium GWC1_42_13]
MFKKLLAAFLLSIFLLTSIFPKGASAQTWYSQGPFEWYSKVYDAPPSEIFGERYTAAQVEWVIYSILTWPFTRILGPEITTCALSLSAATCLSQILSDAGTPSDLASLPKPKQESLLKLMFKDRELSGVTYVKGVVRKFHLIPQAEAQEGFGFTGALLPIQHMWRASRDVSYALFVLVALILAFMIMFRVKISPQVVITAQSALPKILIAVVLVTFSYAIAGFIIDLMYVVIGLISVLATNFFPVGLRPDSPAIFNMLTLGQPWSLNFQLGVVGLFIAYLLVFSIAAILVMAFSVSLIGSTIAALLVGILALSVAPLSMAIFFILFLIVFIILVWMFFKTLFMLFKAYAGVVLLTIFAPFQILIGVLVPSLGFGRWVRSFVANLAVFVVVGMLFLLAFIFVSQALLSISNAVFSGSIPDVIVRLIGGTVASGIGYLLGGVGSAGWPPLLNLGGSGDAAVAFLFLGVSFILFTLVPKAADMIQGLVSGRPFAYGSAIGEAFAPIGAIPGGARTATTIGEAYTKRFGTKLQPSPQAGRAPVPKTAGGATGSGGLERL